MQTIAATLPARANNPAAIAGASHDLDFFRFFGGGTVADGAPLDSDKKSNSGSWAPSSGSWSFSRKRRS